MSWSVSGVGKAAALRFKLAKDFASAAPCLEPEETVRQGAARAIDAALSAQSEHVVVSVSASGHQSTIYGADNTPAGTNNVLTMDVRPLGAFIE